MNREVCRFVLTTKSAALILSSLSHVILCVGVAEKKMHVRKRSRFVGKISLEQYTKKQLIRSVCEDAV